MSTYVPIQAITLSATASSVEFTSIPQTYTDLVVVLEARTSALVDTCIRYNGDTGTNYSFTRLIGNGSAASSSRNSNMSRILMGDSDTGAAMLNTIQIQNYSNTTTNKTTLVRSNKTDRIVFAIAALWRNTAAITSMTLFPDSGTWSSGSTFTLYGIGSGSPKAFGGDEVRTDGTYWYHIFRSSGRFEPVQALSVDYLVVAGGGAGGWRGGGGGGGGFAQVLSNQTVSTSTTVTVGAGGAITSGAIGLGLPGNASSFSSTTSNGGGGGGAESGTSNGGSGGNGGGGGGTTGVGGSATQGNPGGATFFSSGYWAGGGGGSTASGSNGASGVGGNGGAGVTTSISGSSVSYGGGGGGGAWSGTAGTGNGGGGNGGVSSGNAAEGTANRGGGGGGGAFGAGANGGSGIVIVRYAV